MPEKQFLKMVKGAGCTSVHTVLEQVVMIKKEAIQRTAVCFFSSEDDGYVVASPLFENVIGVGDTPEDARKTYNELLDIGYRELERDNVVGYKRGRPAKGNVNLHCQVKPDTHSEIARLTEKLGGISQGEVIEFLLFFYNNISVEVVEKALSTKVAVLGDRVDLLESVVSELKATYSSVTNGKTGVVGDRNLISEENNRKVKAKGAQVRVTKKRPAIQK